ncbi:MAG: hypothetical protein Q7T48_04675 [Cellvibrio sp.]|uniref:hypothetical protein n=1 Tax=Cellvibrio sp. TaxID=1965322 RepID=UPI00271C8730|nr:hypothetical protein [Cellvibrio sp.]
MNKSFDNIVIPLAFNTKPADDIPLVAFLFSRSGKLLEKTVVRGDAVEFKTSGVNPRLYKVMVAPATDKKIEAVQSIAELDRFKPYELVLDINREGFINPVLIPSDFSILWLMRSCRVRGKVIKNFSLGSVSQDRGICHARVHICEVDRIWWLISKIPDRIISKIPEIIATPQWPFPIPEPEPFEPPVFDPVGPVISELNPQPLPPRAGQFNFTAASEFTARSPALLNRLTERKQTLEENASAPAQLAAAQTAILASPKILNQLNSGNTAAIRKSIVENFAIFHPYFCHVPWLWPYFYRCDQVALAYTDLNGAFDITFKYWNNGDKPDLYFWVEYLIDGIWTTVYKPSVPCNTYWDYLCGSAVTIRVTDPRVRWECNDVIDGDIVWIKTIGSSASVSHIKQADQYSVIQGKLFNHVGLTDVFMSGGSSALDNYRRPFGGTLNFVVQFGSGLPANGMYYYRWSYRQLRNADLSNSPATALTSLHKGQALHKAYTYEYFDMLGHKHFGQNTFKLGPVALNGEDDLYIIPPAFPASSPVNAAELSPLWDQNTITASVDSTQFADGLYEFVLELFDVNGNKLAAIPKPIFQVPHYTSFAPSINAPDEYLLVNGVNADGFTMSARVDNQRCEATIYKIKVNGSEVSSDCCGFVPYPPNANIEVAFRAYHPHNFATFSFVVKKGTCNDALQQGFTNVSGMVIGSAGNYTRDSNSIYREGFSPAQLLGICVAGGKAAFAEHVYVTALATNGYDRLSYLDASDLAAFALEPA